MNSDGTDVQQLTNNGNDNRDPAWSPDGQRIAFSTIVGATRDQNGMETVEAAEIMVVNADGSGQVSLTHVLATQGIAAFAPTWSPDSRMIAFNAAEVEALSDAFSGWNIYVINSDGSGDPRRLTDWEPHVGVGCYRQTWSPNGREILTCCRSMMSQAGVSILHLDTGNQENIVEGWYHIVAVSQDGSVAMSDGYGIVLGELSQPSDLHQFMPESADKYPVLADTGEILSLAWSPIEPTRLAMRTGSRLFVLSEFDGSHKELGRDLPTNASLDWSADGSQLVFVASFDGNDEIALADPESLSVIRLTSDPASDDMPVWRPGP